MKNLSGFSKHRKLVLALLLLTVIASASAAVYYALDSRYVVTSAAAKVIFISAADSTSAGLSIPGPNSTFAKLTGIKSYPNATSTYEQAVNVSNTDTVSHSIRLRSISITGGFASYGTILVNMINPAGTRMGNLTYTGGGSSWTTAGSPSAFVSLGSLIKWAIRVDATLNSGAAAGVTTTIELTVDVS